MLDSKVLGPWKKSLESMEIVGNAKRIFFLATKHPERNRLGASIIHQGDNWSTGKLTMDRGDHGDACEQSPAFVLELSQLPSGSHSGDRCKQVSMHNGGFRDRSHTATLCAIANTIKKSRSLRCFSAAQPEIVACVPKIWSPAYSRMRGKLPPAGPLHAPQDLYGMCQNCESEIAKLSNLHAGLCIAFAVPCEPRLHHTSRRIWLS